MKCFYPASSLKSMTKDYNKVKAMEILEDMFTENEINDRMVDSAKNGKWGCIIETEVMTEEVCDELIDLILKEKILKTLNDNGYDSSMRRDKEESTFNCYRLKMFIRWEA